MYKILYFIYPDVSAMKAGSVPHAPVIATPVTERSPNVRDSASSRLMEIHSVTVHMGRLDCIVIKVKHRRMQFGVNFILSNNFEAALSSLTLALRDIKILNILAFQPTLT